MTGIRAALLILAAGGASAAWVDADRSTAARVGDSTHFVVPMALQVASTGAVVRISVDGQAVEYTLDFCPVADWWLGDSGPYFGTASAGSARGADDRTWDVYALVSEIQDGVPTDWDFHLGTPADAGTLTDLDARWDSRPSVYFPGGKTVSGLKMDAELSETSAVFSTEFVDYTRTREGTIPGSVSVTCITAEATPAPSAFVAAASAPPATASSAATPAPSAVVAPPTPQPVGNGSSPGGPRGFAASIVRPAEMPVDLAAIGQSLLIVVLSLLLIPFPAQLFNSTLEANYDEVRGWFARLPLRGARARIGTFWKTRLGIATFVVLASVLYGLLDPSTALDPESLARIAGMGIGIIVTTAAFALPQILAHQRLGDPWRVQVLPGTILIGAACVLVSRLTSFEPGYLYGLLLGFTFGRSLTRDQEGRLNALAAAIMLAVAVLAWVGLGVVGADPGLLGVALQFSLATTMVAGLEGAAFGLIPMRFQPGELVYAWNRIWWSATFAVAMFLLALLLLNPASGYLADSSVTPMITIVGLFVLFAAGSVGFWAYFRFRTPRTAGNTGAKA